VGYYQSWSAAWKSTGAQLDLANIPSYVNVVVVSFVQPDCTYTKGSLVRGGGSGALRAWCMRVWGTLGEALLGAMGAVSLRRLRGSTFRPPAPRPHHASRR
jgi:hypothetical protein